MELKNGYGAVLIVFIFGLGLTNIFKAYMRCNEIPAIPQNSAYKSINLLLVNGQIAVVNF